ncbi:MAG: metal-dependent hydrolase [Halobacteriota archaeon]
MELTWHGHSTWHVTVGDTTLLMDPFFDNPHTSLDPDDVPEPDYVLLTHGHADHVADAGAFSDATLVATPELVGYAQDNFGFEDAVGGMGMNLGGTVECGDAFVTMHRADHSNGIETDYGTSAGMPAGFAISDARPTGVADEEANTFYHAGDTGLMTEMREVIGPYLEPDAAAVPIGDHFTMGPWQAAVAVDWLGVDHAFPMHYDTFPPIEQDPEDFVREVKAAGSDAAVHVLEGDETFTLGE